MSDEFVLKGSSFDGDHGDFMVFLRSVDDSMATIFEAHQGLLSDGSPAARQRFNAAILRDLNEFAAGGAEQ